MGIRNLILYPILSYFAKLCYILSVIDVLSFDTSNLQT